VAAKAPGSHKNKFSDKQLQTTNTAIWLQVHNISILPL